MLHLDRAASTRRIGWPTVAGLVILPLIVALTLLGTTWHRDTRLTQVSGAVVNLDQAVTINGKTVPLGRQLADAIVDRDGANISLTLSDTADADAGLASGTYAVVVTIPKNFSAAATSVSKGADAEQATLQVRTSPSANVQEAAVGAEIARLGTQTLSTSLAKSYVDNIYVGLDSMKTNLTKMATGAKQLSTGATGVANGASSASAGTAKLRDGLGALDAARSQFASSSQLVSSGTALTSGADKLASGIATMQAGVQNSSSDMSQLSALDTGAKQVADGASGVSRGVSQVSGVLNGYANGTSTIPAPKVPASATAAVQQQFVAACTPALVTQLGTGLTQALTQALTPLLGAGAQQTAAAIAGQLASPMATQICQGMAPAMASSFEAGFQQGWKAGVRGGATVGVRALTTKDPRTGQSLVSGASALSTGATKLSGGVHQLVTELPKQTAAQKAQLVSGLGRLHTGATTLASGVRSYTNGTSAFVTGVRRYTDGVGQAYRGSVDLASGMAKLDAGAGKLASGTKTYAEQVAAGAAKVPKYSAGDRAKIATVASQPVQQGQDITEAPLVSTTTLLSVLALWLGALAVYLVIAVVPSRVLTSSRQSWQLVAATLVPGMVISLAQGLALGIVDSIVLGLSPGRAIGLTTFLMGLGVVFVALNHALAAWLGGLGRLLSLTLATLGTAAGLSAVVPSLVSSLAAWSPYLPGLRAARAIATGGSGLTGSFAWLTLWLVGALVASVLSVVRRRRLTASQYRAQLDPA